MNTKSVVSASPGRAGMPSIVSVSLTAALAAFTHAYDFGGAALAVGGIAIVLLIMAGLGYQRTGHRAWMLFYALLNLWIIVGFGIVGGFWNHAVKVTLCAVYGGTLPSSLEPWFISLEPGTVVYEAAGILTFVGSMAAAVFGYRFVRSRPAPTPGTGGAIATGAASRA